MQAEFESLKLERTWAEHCAENAAQERCYRDEKWEPETEAAISYNNLSLYCRKLRVIDVLPWLREGLWEEKRWTFEENYQKFKICILGILEREDQGDRREVIIKNITENNFHHQLMKGLNIQSKRVNRAVGKVVRKLIPRQVSLYFWKKEKKFL